MGKIKEYFLKIKKEREQKKMLMDAAKRFPKDRFLKPAYIRAMHKADEISDEDAIINAIKEKQYYERAKIIEDKVRIILQRHQITEPATFEVSDANLKEAIYVLDVKGLEMPNMPLDETEITIDEIKAGLYRACIGIQASMKYFEIPEEEIEEMVNQLKNMEDGEIKDGDYQKTSMNSAYVANRYAVPEIFEQSDNSEEIEK